MTSSEITVVGCGLVLGYWIVSALFTTKSPTSANFESKSETKDGAQHGESGSKRQRHEAPGEDGDNPANWFCVLEVSEDASEQEIATAYKQKIRQYHPDKVTQMGAEIRQLAEFKSKQINAAYDYAMKLRRKA